MEPGQKNALTDVEGLEVGLWSDLEAATGCAVILVRKGAVAGASLAGHAPGSRETDLLRSEALVQEVQAVFLTGGSAFGLAVGEGVVRFLKEKGLGFPVGQGVVPIVPGAVLFDLFRGRKNRPPDAEAGYRAAQAASSGPIPLGNHGPGVGAVAGGVKGGLGTASLVLEGFTVGALAAVNSFGRPFDPKTGRLYAEPLLFPGDCPGYRPPDRRGPPEDYRIPGAPFCQTTLALVATDLSLTKAQANAFARMAQAGMARALRPAFTLLDGDIVFALSTGKGGAPDPLTLTRAGAAAADALARAIARAVWHAEGGVAPSYREVVGL